MRFNMFQTNFATKSLNIGNCFHSHTNTSNDFDSTRMSPSHRKVYGLLRLLIRIWGENNKM